MQADLLGELAASGIGEVLALDVQDARRDLEQVLPDGVAVLAHQHHGAVGEHRHDGDRRHVVDDLAFGLVAVGHPHGVHAHGGEAVVHDSGIQRLEPGHSVLPDDVDLDLDRVPQLGSGRFVQLDRQAPEQLAVPLASGDHEPREQRVRSVGP